MVDGNTRLGGHSASMPERTEESLWTGVLGTVYSAWLLHAAGPQYLLMSTVFFVTGIPVFWFAQREKDLDYPIVRSSSTARTPGADHATPRAIFRSAYDPTLPVKVTVPSRTLTVI